jgi:hypothetical protein
MIKQAAIFGTHQRINYGLSKKTVAQCLIYCRDNLNHLLLKTQNNGSKNFGILSNKQSIQEELRKGAHKTELKIKYRYLCHHLSKTYAGFLDF